MHEITAKFASEVHSDICEEIDGLPKHWKGYDPVVLQNSRVPGHFIVTLSEKIDFYNAVEYVTTFKSLKPIEGKVQFKGLTNVYRKHFSKLRVEDGYSLPIVSYSHHFSGDSPTDSVNLAMRNQNVIISGLLNLGPLGFEYTREGSNSYRLNKDGLEVQAFGHLSVDSPPGIPSIQIAGNQVSGEFLETIEKFEEYQGNHQFHLKFA